MGKNIMNKKSKYKFLPKVTLGVALLVVLLIIFLLPRIIKSKKTNYELSVEDTEGKLANIATVAAQEPNGEFCYLSDIPYIRSQSSSGWGSICLDQANGGSLISVKVEGAYYEFEKGIWAHAQSRVVYDLNDYSEYDYFTTYMALNRTAASSSNGVKFYIYTSVDGTNWDLQTEEEPVVTKAGDNATFVKINIKDARYLKLEANANGANGNDHSVYADAKLIKSTYKEPGEELVPDIKALDEKIKTVFTNADLSTNQEYELTLLKRELVNRVGNYALRKFLSESEENKAVYEWLTGDVDNLRLYIMGGTPDGGSYYNSLTLLSKLYDEYSTDFTNDVLIDNEWCPEGMTRGDLYKKMAITLSLTHSQNLGLWMQAGATENKSDALKRYAIYKYMYENGKFDASTLGSIWDMTKWFESLQVEEMRFIMNNLIDDEEILWLNTYVQDKIVQYGQSKYLTPHPYIAYVWPNYGNPVYYDPNNESYFNELFAVNRTSDNTGKELVNEDGENTGKVGLFDTEFTIPGGKNNSTYTFKVTKGTPDYKLYKVWMNFRNKFGTGCVCGGISKSGSNIRTTHGIPATVIGQPGHAALLCYAKNTQGQGYWGIDNDVSGWTLSEKGERMLLGWGNASYSRGYSVVYMVLAQEAINDYENLVKAEEQVMLAKVYNDDLLDETKKQATLEKQEEIYRKALEIQPINIDAWYNLINVYNANESKTENDFYNLAEEIAEELKCFPLPMYHLTNLIKPRLTSIQNSYRFTLLQTRILTEGSTLPNTATDQVLQPAITRVEANYLLGKLDKTIATFSFDGADAGKIVLSSRFDGNGVRWDYSIDGKQTWNEVSFTAEQEHKLQLTQEQIASITAENDIYVHIVGVGYEEENLYKIDILDNVITEAMYFGNDLENRVIGVDTTCEWRNSESSAWTSYAVASPDNTGDKTLQIRQSANGTKLASNVLTFTFTEDNQPDTRKYIPVSHLSIHSVSTEAVNQGGSATKAIDANYNTRWHSAWNGSDTNRFIVIKLDKSVVLSAVEFVPAGGGNGKIYDGTIWGSMDGENWEILSQRTGITYTNQANTNADAIANTKSFEIENPKEVQYVKIVADRTNGNWFTAREFNLYQDLTKNPHPTAGIEYSTTEPTNGNVIARIVNPSTEITITNNDGMDTYVFTENGEFTFEFVDANGNTGTAVAKVNWIDKKGPTADIKYGLSDDKKLSIILDNISEDVYLLDENNNKINYIEVDNNKKVTNISYLDELGNAYKILDKDINGNTTKITYKNTTGNVSTVATYITTLENGEVTREEYFDNEGNAVTVTDAEKEELRRLQQTTRSNPLERALETSGDYEFKMLDKADNLLYKSIKVDYINNDTTILASDITYNITKETNQSVVATIKPYIIDINGNKDLNVEVVNDGGTTHTFIENGTFTFEYREQNEDNYDNEVKTHIAKVNWIDKIAPTAQIRYSTQETTDKAVTATLVDESEEITIINNGASREHTFNENGEFIFEFEDKAGNKGTAKAKVDWIKKEQENPDQPVVEKITSKIYKIEERHILRIPHETTVTTFKENVETEQDMVFTDKNEQILNENDIVKTGTQLKVGKTLEYTLIVEGDLDGNGKITITDLTKMKLHIIKKEMLEGDYLRAADLNGNDEVTITDLVQLKLRFIGKNN